MSAAPSWSVIVIIMLKPLSISSGPTKSMLILLKQPLGTGRGCRGPVGFDVGPLLRRHCIHEGIYELLRSCHI